MQQQKINGIMVYYEQHGSHTAYPVVFINGLLADTTGWAFQVPAFVDSFRVVLYDCRGQGQSDKPPGPYSPTLHAQDLLALLDSLDIQRAYIVGLSNGGTVAMSLAVQHPERIARLVLADTFAYTDAILQAKLQSWLTALEVGGPGMRFDMATPWVWGQTFLANNQHLLAPLREKAAQADPKPIQALIEGALSFDIRDDLHAIQAPTLILVGEEDVLTPPWYARALAHAIPNARLCIVPQAGHALPIEQPALFNALTRSFLNE